MARSQAVQVESGVPRFGFRRHVTTFRAQGDAAGFRVFTPASIARLQGSTGLSALAAFRKLSDSPAAIPPGFWEGVACWAYPGRDAATIGTWEKLGRRVS